jgi:hypothetical protein
MGNIDSQPLSENIIFNVVYLNLRENGTDKMTLVREDQQPCKYLTNVQLITFLVMRTNNN